MPEPCDCTVWCGDDPWLKDGRSEPCAHKKKADADAARAARRIACTNRLLDELGYSGNVLGALEELKKLRTNGGNT